MPRQTKNQTSTTPVVAETPAPVEPVAEPVPATKPRASRKKAVAEPVAEAIPVAEAPAPASEPVVEEATPTEGESRKSTRVAPTRDSLMTGFFELLSLLEQQTTQLREGSDKAANNIRFLRSVTKRVRDLQTTSARLLRQKLPSQRKNNNSGFLKPTKISAEMAKFTGLDVNTLHSRVDITKFICKYIDDKKLQNKDNHRNIDADPALAKLLGYDPKKSDKPLTYPYIQSLLKVHFPKAPVATA